MSHQLGRRQAIVWAGVDPARIRPEDLEQLVYVGGDLGPAGRAGEVDDQAAKMLFALLKANQGRRRAMVIEVAGGVLDNAARTDAKTIWRALLALVCADELRKAELYCQRLTLSTDLMVRAAAEVMLARVYARAGRSSQAVDLLLPLIRNQLPRRLEPLAIAWLASALVDLGELEQATGLLRDWRYDGQLDLAHGRAELLASRGVLQLATGRFDAAYEDFCASGRELTDWAVINPGVVPWRSLAALCAHMTGRDLLARALAQDDLAASRTWGAARTVGFAHQMSARVIEDESSRLATLREAESNLAGSGALLDLVRTRYDLAVVLAGQGDDVLAAEELNLAQGDAAAIGNQLWNGRITTALAQLDSSSSSGRLSRQEAAVAREVQPGRTNREIAERMHLTVRTIEFHLSSVYRKLGITGRSELRQAMILTHDGSRARLQPIVW
ncbi:LuxR C-terminal-related transcriptional regulator [Kribbella sp. NPDC056861]|uniref:helix-turn-helix transcriptional regulator n=1 Tax=Kribbella sp. NPDC056861 TaxID=3154857 RepID=UPI003419528E